MSVRQRENEMIERRAEMTNLVFPELVTIKLKTLIDQDRQFRWARNKDLIVEKGLDRIRGEWDGKKQNYSYDSL